MFQLSGYCRSLRFSLRIRAFKASDFKAPGSGIFKVEERQLRVQDFRSTLTYQTLIFCRFLL